MKNRMLRGLAAKLIGCAAGLLPASRAEWGRAMRSELDVVESDWVACHWAAGCVLAALLERSASRREALMKLVRKPSAFVPITMSLLALAVVLVTLAAFGIPQETDEGTAAHLWQLLMAGQVPVLLFFLVKWLPRAPRETLKVVVLQMAAALAALAPVYLLHL